MSNVRAATFQIAIIIALQTVLGCGGGGNSSPARFAGTYAGTWQRQDASSSGTMNVTFDSNGNGTGTLTHSNFGNGTLIQATIGGSGQTDVVALFSGNQGASYAGKLQLNGPILSGTLRQDGGDKTFPTDFSLSRQ